MSAFPRHVLYTRELLRPHPVFIATSQGTVQTVQTGLSCTHTAFVRPFSIGASHALWSLSKLPWDKGGLAAWISWQFTAGSTQRDKQEATLTPLDNLVPFRLMCRSLNCWRKQEYRDEKRPREWESKLPLPSLCEATAPTAASLPSIKID